MAEGKTNAGGGGINKSQIIVTAPTGSTVTCSNGTVTKTAAEKDGTWTFKNCDFGKWEIKATLGGKSKTATYELTRLEIVYITINFDLHLYKMNDQCVDVSGGWACDKYYSDYGEQAWHSATEIGLKITSTANSSSSGFVHANNKIDLTDWSKICVKCRISKAFENQKIIVENKTVNDGSSPVAEQDISASGEVYLDVSSLSGEYYIGVRADNSYSGKRGAEIYIEEVKLE